jgi:hypothetical protein
MSGQADEPMALARVGGRYGRAQHARMATDQLNRIATRAATRAAIGPAATSSGQP